MNHSKFKSNAKLDLVIKSLLANSRFSSFQEYVEWRVATDLKLIERGLKLK